MMILVQALTALMLLLGPTPQASHTDTAQANVFTDLGSQHCATEMAIAAYQNTGDSGQTVAGAPVFATFSAFTFASAGRAQSTLDDIPLLVAKTYTDDTTIDVSKATDEIAITRSLGNYGDASAAYSLAVPVDGDGIEYVYIDMMAIVEHNQLALILLFSDTDGSRITPRVSAAILTSFADGITARWDGQGSIEDAIPRPTDMPERWTGKDVSMVKLPTCQQNGG